MFYQLITSILNLIDYTLITQLKLICNSNMRIIVLLHQCISNKHNSKLFGIACYNFTTKKRRTEEQSRRVPPPPIPINILNTTTITINPTSARICDLC